MKYMLLAVSCLLTMPGSVSAQMVRGEVRDPATGDVVRGTFVVLTDADGRGRHGVLADSLGRFLIRAPAAGSYRLGAQRIGYESYLSPTFTLSAQEMRTHDLQLTVSALRLPEITARAERRCGGDRERAVETARVWEEARKALTVAAWLENEAGAQFRVRTFEQRLNRNNQQVGDEVMNFDVMSGKKAFVTAPADSLMQVGFVQPADDDFDFYGPDAELLISDAFLDRHCFWVVREREHPGLIGLAFEPMRSHRVSGIRGVLWLDEQKAALRFVEYDYVNLPFFVDRRFAGGRTDYQQLPNGAWLVSHWDIRMPEGGTSRGRRLEPEHVRRVGAEVLDARLPDAEVLSLVPSFTVTGMVFDSLRAEPLRNARVSLIGTPFETLTDERGRFRLDSVPRGIYYSSLAHVRIDSMPASVPRQRVQVDSALRELTLATPDPERLRNALCAPDVMIEMSARLPRPTLQLGLLRVRVVDDQTGAALRNYNVTAEWAASIPLLDARGPQAVRSSTNEEGQAVLCGVPTDHVLHLFVQRRGDRWRGPVLKLPPERMYQLTVRLPAH